MIAVIFEFWPTESGTAEYFDLAAKLRSELQQIDGFLSIERFESVTEKGKFVSLSFWRDEAAVAIEPVALQPQRDRPAEQHVAHHLEPCRTRDHERGPSVDQHHAP